MLWGSKTILRNSETTTYHHISPPFSDQNKGFHQPQRPIVSIQEGGWGPCGPLQSIDQSLGIFTHRDLVMPIEKWITRNVIENVMNNQEWFLVITRKYVNLNFTIEKCYEHISDPTRGGIRKSLTPVSWTLGGGKEGGVSSLSYKGLLGASV